MLYSEICGGNRCEGGKAPLPSVIEGIMGNIIGCPCEDRETSVPIKRFCCGK